MRYFLHRNVRSLGPPVLLAVLTILACTNDAPPAGPAHPGGDPVDTSPPARVVDAALTFNGEDAVLTWTAPTDNDRVEAYDIRYSYSFPLHWELSLRADNPPEPLAPGQLQSYTIVSPLRGRELFAAIRSADPSGNVSPTSAVAQMHLQGYAIDVACVAISSEEPVAGLDVTITSRHVRNHVTDAAGLVTQEDLTAGAVNIAVRPGSSGTPYHHMNDPFELTGDTARHYKLVRYQPTELGIFESTLALFATAVGITAQRPVFKKWHSLPVPVYLPPYVNGSGIDYADVGRRAAQRWEERAGIDLWSFVSQPADTGVAFQYKTRAQMGIQVGVTVNVNGRDGYPLQSKISVVDDFATEGSLFKTMLHELGHAIRFAHLPAGYLMYEGQPLPDDVTNDEAQVVRLFAAMPNGTDVTVYDVDVPVEAGNAGRSQAGGK